MNILSHIVGKIFETAQWPPSNYTRKQMAKEAWKLADTLMENA